MNERFIKIPDGVSVHSIGLGAKKVDSDRRFTNDKTITTPRGRVYDLHPRRVRGMTEFIPEQETSGSVCVDKHGTKIDWFLCKEAGSSGDPSYGPEGARIVVEYESEFEGLTYLVAYDKRNNSRDFCQFGINEKNVANR